MTLALDTDVLVAWAMQGAPHHDAVRRLVADECAEPGGVGVTAQVLFELLHVATDPRRFEEPIPMEEALLLCRRLWDAKDIRRITPGPLLLHQTLDLMTSHRLGRKRILDTALAATLKEAGISRLATFNVADFEDFSFLELVDPSL